MCLFLCETLVELNHDSVFWWFTANTLWRWHWDEVAVSHVGFARVGKERLLEVSFLLSRLFHLDHNLSLVCKNWNTIFSYKLCSRSGLFLQGKWKTWALSALAQLCEAVFGGQPWLQDVIHVASTWLSFHKTVADFFWETFRMNQPGHFDVNFHQGVFEHCSRFRFQKQSFIGITTRRCTDPIYLLTVILTQIGKPLETLENIVFRTRIFGTNLSFADWTSRGLTSPSITGYWLRWPKTSRLGIESYSLCFCRGKCR